MKKNKLIDYVNTFTKEDWKAFNKFLKQNHHRRPDMLAIFGHLEKKLRNKNGSEFDMDNFHKQIRPDLSRKSFQNILSEFCDVVEDYFVWNEFSHDSIQYNLILLKNLRKRGLFQAFDKNADKLRKSIGGGPLDLWNSFWFLLINHLQYYSDNPIKNQKGGSMMSSIITEFENMTNQLGAFYKAELLNRNTLFSENWEEKIESLPENQVGDSFIDTICHSLCAIQTSDRVSFDFLMQILYENHDELSNELKLVILLQLMKSKTKYLSDSESQRKSTLRLYEFALNHGLLNLNGSLPLVRFHNIVDIGCSIQAYDWVNNNLVTWCNQVNAIYRDEAKILAKAQIAFSQKDKEEGANMVIDLLNRQVFKDIKQELRARAMLLCSYYELEEIRENYELFQSQLRKFDRFVSRRKHEMTENEYLGLRNLGKCIKYLTKLNVSNSRKLDMLLEQGVFFKSWVMGKKESPDK